MKLSMRIILVTVTCTTLSCATSPLGRKQLIMVPESELNAMGAQTFSDMKRKTPIESGTRTSSYVQCIAKAVAESVKDEIDPDSWEIVTFRDKQVNAFALPGSKIGVYTGILPVAKTQHQLAAVLGHEVAHVIARHGNERVSEAQAAQGGALIASAVTKNNQYANLGYSMAAQLLFLLPNSRTHESEADIMGLDYMAKAGFDPRESVTLWQNMAKAGGGSGPQFLSTHPSHDTRISQLQEHMKNAMSLYEKARAEGKNPQCESGK